MNKITQSSLGYSSFQLLLPPPQAKQRHGVRLVATLFNGEIGADGMRYFIKNLDGTMYNSNVSLVDGGPSVDSALGEKIFIYYWANESYGFFCKKPQRGSLSRSLSVTSGNS